MTGKKILIGKIYLEILEEIKYWEILSKKKDDNLLRKYFDKWKEIAKSSKSKIG